MSNASSWNPMKKGVVDTNTPRACKDCGKVLPVSMFCVNGNGYYENICRECKAAREKERYNVMKQGNTARYWDKRIAALRANAEKRGLSFNLTSSDLMALYEQQGGKCWYTGEPLRMGSVDRIDADRGYAPDNIIMCELDINKFRAERSRDAFILLCHAIARKHPII